MFVSRFIHTGKGGRSDAAGRGSFLEQFVQRNIGFAPGQDAVGEGMSGGGHRCLGIEAEFHNLPLGRIAQERLADQVGLITSLPREAAERVRQIANQAAIGGHRHPAITPQIMALGDITKNRARVIAHTEVGRTLAEIQRARAQFAGSTHFKWLSVHDNRVRPLHRQLDGHVFRWDEPPIADERTGATSLPGAIYNCRCVGIPLFAND